MQETISTLQDRVNAALLASDWATLNELVSADARVIGLKGFTTEVDHDR